MKAEILKGWKRIESGPLQSGDKRWSARLSAWLPVVKGDGFWGKLAEKLPTLAIRRGER